MRSILNKTDRDIFGLAWPNIVSNVSVPLLSSVDTALMGGLSALHLGAVGLGAMIFNFFYWNFGFLRMGTTGMTAQAFGADRTGQLSSVFYRALVIALTIAMFLLLFRTPISILGVRVMNAEDDMINLIHIYVMTRIWAAPATLGLYVLFGWLFGMQNARFPMYVTIAINLVNIFVSYALIVLYQYGIYGVALGTVVAQYFGFLLTLGLIVGRYRGFIVWPGWKVILDRDAFVHFFSINGDIFIRTVCLTAAFAFFYSQSSQYGEWILGVNVVLLQFLNWMSYGIDGFAYAAESLVGKWFGARNEEMVRRTISRSFLWAGIGALLFSLIYGLFGDQIFLIFTQSDQIIDVSHRFLGWMMLMPILGFSSYIWDGIYVGMTASRAMRNTMILSLMVYLGSYFMFEKALGPHALWLALAAFLATRGLIQHILFQKYGMQLK